MRANGYFGSHFFLQFFCLQRLGPLSQKYCGQKNEPGQNKSSSTLGCCVQIRCVPFSIFLPPFFCPQFFCLQSFCLHIMRILLTGASGQLGGYVIDQLVHSSLDVVAWSGSRTGSQGSIRLDPVDLSQTDQVATTFHHVRQSLVIHAAAISNIADCYRNPTHAEAVNVRGTACLAELAERSGARFLYVSTDLVFDGEKGLYAEADPPSPLSAYGRTKELAERFVLELRNTVVARLSLMYGPSRIGRPSFFDQQLAAIHNRQPFTLFEDEWRSPLDLQTAARALLSIARSDYCGLLHVGGPQRMSRLEMGERVAKCLGLNANMLVAAKRLNAPFPEPRPRDCSLDSSRWRELFPDHPWPNLEQATRAMFE
jgi:dTDP-4-dehydrorhamnose reductase